MVGEGRGGQNLRASCIDGINGRASLQYRINMPLLPHFGQDRFAL